MKKCFVFYLNYIIIVIQYIQDRTTNFDYIETINRFILY